MRKATNDPSVAYTSDGPIDLTTPAGLDRAADLALAHRDRGLFNRIRAQRNAMRAGGSQRAGAGDVAAVLQKMRQIEAGDSRPRPASGGSPLAARMRVLSAACRAIRAKADADRVAGVLQTGGRRPAGPARDIRLVAKADGKLHRVERVVYQTFDEFGEPDVEEFFFDLDSDE